MTLEHAELVARLRGGGHLHVEAATAIETLERERDEAREREQALWDKPEMRDPRPGETLEDWVNDIPHRGQWAVPGVIARAIERAMGESSRSAEPQVANLERERDEANILLDAEKFNNAELFDRAFTAEARVAKMEGANCPRPCNNRPDDFTIGQCNDAGECGCEFHRDPNALHPEPSP